MSRLPAAGPQPSFGVSPCRWLQEHPLAPWPASRGRGPPSAPAGCGPREIFLRLHQGDPGAAFPEHLGGFPSAALRPQPLSGISLGTAPMPQGPRPAAPQLGIAALGLFLAPQGARVGCCPVPEPGPRACPHAQGALKPSVTSLALCWGITARAELAGLLYKSSQQPGSRRGTSHTPRHPLLAPSPLFASISRGELRQAQGAARGRGAQPGPIPVPVPTGICPVCNLFGGQQGES